MKHAKNQLDIMYRFIPVEQIITTESIKAKQLSRSVVLIFLLDFGDMFGVSICIVNVKGLCSIYKHVALHRHLKFYKVNQ